MDEALPSRLRPGVREIELSAFLEGDLRARRHQGVIRVRRWNMEMYVGVTSAGASACYPCYFDGPDGLEALYPAFPATPPAWAVAAALFVSLAVGLVFGVMPAMRATRLDPVAALARK